MTCFRPPAATKTEPIGMLIRTSALFLTLPIITRTPITKCSTRLSNYCATRFLMITYKPYKFDAYSYILYPYLLKQHNNRWFLFGRIDEVKKEYLKDPNEKIQDVNQDYWNVPLDRIENVEVLKDVPFIPRPAHYGDPFTEVIGVTNKKLDPIEIIRYIAKGSTAYYIATKPLHASQDSQWIDNETLDVKLQVKINPELTHLLLSYAPSITILSPQSLVEDHKDSLRKALEQYQ